MESPVSHAADVSSLAAWDALDDEQSLEVGLSEVAVIPPWLREGQGDLWVGAHEGQGIKASIVRQK
jgi:hypothetical protein